MNELKQSEVVKFITVTLTQILQEVELLNLQLTGIEVFDNTHVVIKISIINTCLPAAANNDFTVTIRFATLEKAMEKGTVMLLKVLQNKVGVALLQKRKNHGT